MKPAQQRVSDSFRYSGAGGDIFRKARVIARREDAFRPQAIAARGKAQRILGSEVDMVGCRGVQPLGDGRETCQSKSDLAVSET